MRRPAAVLSGVVICNFGKAFGGFCQSPKYFCARAKPLAPVMSPPMTRIALSGR